MDERIPIFVLTGFLGSGKSTLLSACIHKKGLDRIAIIVNEFGEIGLDHLIVTKGGEDTILLDSGCLCCLSNNQIQDTLLVLHARRKRGEVQFDRIVIETSGLAEPGPMLRPLLVDAFVSRNFRFARVTTVIDAKLAPAQFAQYAEARNQVACADRIVVSKCDIANELEISAAMAGAIGLNSTAEIVQSKPATQSASEILGFGELNDQHTVLAAVRDAATEHDHDSHGNAVHTHGITTVTLRPSKPVSWPNYSRWLEKLRATDGSRLLRTKGILLFDDGIYRVIQGVQHAFSPPAPYDGKVDQSFIVMITRDYDRTKVQALCSPLAGAADL